MATLPQAPQDGAIYETLRAKLHRLYERDQYDIHERVLAFHDYLKQKYPDPRDRRLFHLISGSTLKDAYSHLDFPKPDSVADFINSEYAVAFPPVKV
jgi:hypothetical protein